MPRRRPSAAPEDHQRLIDMLAAARDAVGFIVGRSRSDLDTDRMLRRAMISAIQEIGEAAARTGDTGRNRVVGVPWGQIVEMRNIIVHVYWGVDLDHVWDTAKADLPPFIGALEAALARWDDEPAQRGGGGPATGPT